MRHERGSVACGQPLAGGFVALLVAVGPVADGLDHDPVYLGVLAGDVQARAFHLAAEGFRPELLELLPVVEMVHQLLAGQDQAELDFGVIPVQIGLAEIVDQPW